MSETPNPSDEPSLVLVFPAHQWQNIVHPITRLELMDWAIQHACIFFLDTQSHAYVTVVKVALWKTLDEDAKTRFKIISRRIREEIDGPFTDEQRRLFEADPFEEVLPIPDTVNEEEKEDKEDKEIDSDNDNNIDITKLD